MKVKWEEPVAFARAVARATEEMPTRKKQIWIGLGAAATIAVLIPAFQLLFYLLHKKEFEVPLWIYFFAPAITGLFVGYLPFMIAAIPAKIVLDVKGVHRLKPIGTMIAMQCWPWEAISALTVETVKYGQAPFRVLIVHCDREAGEILLGLGMTSVESIDEVARQMGKHLEIRP